MRTVLIERLSDPCGGVYVLRLKRLNREWSVGFYPRHFERVTGFKLPIGASPIRVSVHVRRTRAK